jgi:hypothetical protein
VVPLDAVRARELSGKGDGLRSVTDVLLDQLAAAGTAVSEIVLDVSDGRLRALMTLVHDGETDVVGATAEEGVALALRGDLKLYATDEAIAHAAARSAKPARHGGAGGSDTIH